MGSDGGLTKLQWFGCLIKINIGRSITPGSLPISRTSGIVKRSLSPNWWSLRCAPISNCLLPCRVGVASFTNWTNDWDCSEYCYLAKMTLCMKSQKLTSKFTRSQGAGSGSTSTPKMPNCWPRWRKNSRTQSGRSTALISRQKNCRNIFAITLTTLAIMCTRGGPNKLVKYWGFT